MGDDEHRQQINFLLKDAAAAHTKKDLDGMMFSLLQIFKLCEAHNKTKPPPSPEQIKALEDLAQELGSNPEQIMERIGLVYRWFGEEPPE